MTQHSGVVLAVLAVGGKQIVDGRMAPGELMSFLVTSQTIQRSMTQLSVLFGQAVRGYTAGARVFEVDGPPIFEVYAHC